jgi:hypothetical protein
MSLSQTDIITFFTTSSTLFSAKSHWPKTIFSGVVVLGMANKFHYTASHPNPVMVPEVGPKLVKFQK